MVTNHFIFIICFKQKDFLFIAIISFQTVRWYKETILSIHTNIWMYTYIYIYLYLYLCVFFSCLCINRHLFNSSISYKHLLRTTTYLLTIMHCINKRFHHHILTANSLFIIPYTVLFLPPVSPLLFVDVFAIAVTIFIFDFL